MQAESAGPGSRTAGRLSAADIRHLRALGTVIRAASRSGDRDDAIQALVNTARRHRAAGASWDEVSVAAGFHRSTIRRWRLITQPKPDPPADPVVSSAPLPPIADPLPARQTGLPGSLSLTTRSESRVATQGSISSSASGSLRLGVTIPGTVHTRRVLCVSGDPSRRGNRFDIEAASIRQLLGPAAIEVTEVACAELADITEYVRRHLPAVLHVAAHSEYGGIFLSLDEEPLPVTHDAFRASLIRCRVRPRLLVLNICDSSPLAKLLTPDIETVIAWPGAVDDKQARVFAHHLYRPLASGGLIDTAFGTARDTVQEKWPDLMPPELSGTARTGLF